MDFATNRTAVRKNCGALPQMRAIKVAKNAGEECIKFEQTKMFHVEQ
jgi:hypothetical protein